MKKKIIKNDETLADLENKPAGVISVKNKLNITANFISKQAKEKIEKIGGKLTLLKK